MNILRAVRGCLILVAGSALGACSAESSGGLPEELTGEASETTILPPGLFTTIPANDEDDCKMLPPDGIRPTCAVTSWDPGILECTIVNYNPGCVCYAGQTRTCKFANPIQRCTPFSDTCGSKSCVVTNDNSSTWGPCLPVP
jgi:hypothetical protein